MKVLWNDKVIADSNETIVIENNHYFPPESVNKEFLEDNSLETVCPWKGTASYFNLVDGNEKEIEAAWYYANPKAEASQIKDYVAFYKNKVEFLPE